MKGLAPQQSCICCGNMTRGSVCPSCAKMSRKGKAEKRLRAIEKRLDVLEQRKEE